MQRNAEAQIIIDMKKVLFVGILCILSVSATFAQTRFGVTAGLNTSNITGDDVNGKYKAGFQAGLVADFGITENFSVIPELLFSQRGGKENLGDGTYSMTLNYLQLPVNLAYKFHVGYGSKLFIFAGPYVGYGISASEKITGSGASASVPLEFGSGTEQIKPLDFGVNAGIGYQYEKIFFKLQYNLGLANMSNVESASMKNTNIAVTVGYFFK